MPGKEGVQALTHINLRHWHLSNQAPGTSGRQMLFLPQHWENLPAAAIFRNSSNPTGAGTQEEGGADLRCQAQEIGPIEAPALPCEGPRRTKESPPTDARAKTPSLPLSELTLLTRPPPGHPSWTGFPVAGALDSKDKKAHNVNAPRNHDSGTQLHLGGAEAGG